MRPWWTMPSRCASSVKTKKPVAPTRGASAINASRFG
jgi:hypothetical protein